MNDISLAAVRSRKNIPRHPYNAPIISWTNIQICEYDHFCWQQEILSHIPISMTRPYPYHIPHFVGQHIFHRCTDSGCGTQRSVQPLRPTWVVMQCFMATRRPREPSDWILLGFLIRWGEPYPWRIHGAGIYANIGGILMGSMLPYIAAPWILWVMKHTLWLCQNSYWKIHHAINGKTSYFNGPSIPWLC